MSDTHDVLTPNDTSSAQTEATRIDDLRDFYNKNKDRVASSGGGEILLSSNISGSTAYSLVKILNTEFAISALLPQISATINRLLKQQFNKAAKEAADLTQRQLQQNGQRLLMMSMILSLSEEVRQA